MPDLPPWSLEILKPKGGTVEISSKDIGPHAEGDFPPARLAPVIEGCAWLRHCRDDAAQLPENEWYAMLSIIGRCENGAQLAQEWSKSHREYDPTETTEKLHHALTAAGPRTCADIRCNGGERFCAQCAHAGRVRSPIILGTKRRKTTMQFADNKRFTDTGNARALVIAHGEDIRHVREWGWLAWDGARWQRHAEKEVQRRAKLVADHFVEEIKDEPDDKLRESMAKWAAKSLNQDRLNAMVKNAESEAEVDTSPADFDRDPWLLNCANGTVNLRTGLLEAHFREDFITKLAPVDFNPAATGPQWEAFLEKIFFGNRDLIAFVQRAIGYSLTGQQSERVMFILCSRAEERDNGQNGKTTLLETIRFVLGDYAGQIPVECLMVQKNFGRPGATPEIADLKGLRFVTTSETGKGQRLAEPTIKLLTGGNTIKARHLYEEHVEFRPSLHLFMECNYKPQIRGTDEAIWDRIRLIPFLIRITDEEKDGNLGEKLKVEAPGILRWAVEGCLAWQRDGLGAPIEIEDARREYRADEDVLGQFLAERVFKSPGDEVLGQTMFQAYLNYCHSSGAEEPSRQGFFMEMRNRDIDRRTHKDTRLVWYVNVSLDDPHKYEKRSENTRVSTMGEGT